MSTIYIAYGSNMCTARLKERCKDAAEINDQGIEGVIKNYRLMFKKSKSGYYATIEPCLGKYVPVVVWEISENDEAELDRKEGVHRHLYYKKYLDVEVNDQVINGLAYLLPENHHFGMPPKWYYELLECVYEKRRFDKRILEEAAEYTEQYSENTV